VADHEQAYDRGAGGETSRCLSRVAGLFRAGDKHREPVVGETLIRRCRDEPWSYAGRFVIERYQATAQLSTSSGHRTQTRTTTWSARAPAEGNADRPKRPRFRLGGHIPGQVVDVTPAPTPSRSPARSPRIRWAFTISAPLIQRSSSTGKVAIEEAPKTGCESGRSGSARSARPQSGPTDDRGGRVRGTDFNDGNRKKGTRNHARPRSVYDQGTRPGPAARQGHRHIGYGSQGPSQRLENEGLRPERGGRSTRARRAGPARRRDGLKVTR